MTVLVDTSVWIDHLRRGNDELARLLDRGLVICHEHVIGELACGGLRQRREILGMLKNLPRAPEAGFDEVMTLIDRHSLFGRGLGWIDLHLVASALLGAVPLWTLDRRLASVADDLGCRWDGMG